MAEETELTFVRCPSCRSLMPAVATKCRMCGFQMEGATNDVENISKKEVEPQRPKRGTQNIPKETIDEVKAGVDQPVAPIIVQPMVVSPEPIKVKSVPQEFFPPVVEVSEPKKGFNFHSELPVATAPKIEEQKVPQVPNPQSSKGGLSFKVQQPQIRNDQQRSDQQRNDQQRNDQTKNDGVKQQPAGQNFNSQQNQNRQSNQFENQQKNQTPKSQPELNKLPSLEQKPQEQKLVNSQNLNEVRQVKQSDLRGNDTRINEARNSEPKNNEVRTIDNKLSLTKPQQTGNNQQNRQENQNDLNALKVRNIGKLVGWLLSFSESEKGTSYELREGKCFIGKTKLREGDIVINRDSISNPHMLLDVKNEEVRAQDMLSDHGVLVYQGSTYQDLGEIVNLKHGDKIKVGDIELIVCLAKL